MDHISAVLIGRNSIFHFEQLDKILIFSVTNHLRYIRYTEFES